MIPLIVVLLFTPLQLIHNLQLLSGKRPSRGRGRLPFIRHFLRWKIGRRPWPCRSGYQLTSFAKASSIPPAGFRIHRKSARNGSWQEWGAYAASFTCPASAPEPCSPLLWNAPPPAPPPQPPTTHLIQSELPTVLQEAVSRTAWLFGVHSKLSSWHVRLALVRSKSFCEVSVLTSQVPLITLCV